ncbi:hypothetical protein DTO207G8_8893 [Paecilomyces variotii]|nr:hypothetical protein DTO169E5_7071 [Paecilomyces variotii]KAJ9246503.1 hypothetical protein DTO207G8_8893 [Paecilomyces variotii]
MGLSPSGSSHHRRRSSVLTGGPSQYRPVNAEPQEDSPRFTYGDGDASRMDEQKPLTADRRDSSDLSSIAESEELTLSDDDQDDEEMGLTAKERSHRRLKRKKQRRHLDARIAGVKASKQESLADKNVVKRLLINASLISLWYLFSLSISIYNKWMFSEDKVVFPFPLFTTSLHMLVQFTFSSIILYFIPSLRPQPQSVGDGSHDTKPIMTKLFYATRLLPCGTATSLDIGLGNMSLKFISLTFLTMCKSSALAFVLLFAFVFRLERPSVKLILIIATMTAGVVMMVAGETAFNALGFALVIASAFFSGFRWGLTQILLLRHPATSNPFSTLFFLTPIMFVTLILIALAVEGPHDVMGGFAALAAAHGTVGGVLLLIFPGVLAFCMIASEFALLKRSSVVTLSICGIFKEVVTISAAGVIFHDKLTPVNVSGLIVTIASIGSYNYMKISAMRQEAQKNLERGQHRGSDASGRSVRRRMSTGSTLEVGTASGRYKSIGNSEGHGDTFSPVSDSGRPERHSFSIRASGTSNVPNIISAPATSMGDHFNLGQSSNNEDPERHPHRDQHDSSHRSRSASASSGSSSSSS